MAEGSARRRTLMAYASMLSSLIGMDLQAGTLTSIFATKVWRCSPGSGKSPSGSGSSGRSLGSGGAFGVLLDVGCLALVTVEAGATEGGGLVAATDVYVGVDMVALRGMAGPLPENCVSFEKLSDLLVEGGSVFVLVVVLLFVLLVAGSVPVVLSTCFSESSSFLARLVASFMISSVLLAFPKEVVVSIASILSLGFMMLAVVPFFPLTGGVVPFSRLRLKRALISRRALPGGDCSIPSRIEGKSSSERSALERVDAAIGGGLGDGRSVRLQPQINGRVSSVLGYVLIPTLNVRVVVVSAATAW